MNKDVKLNILQAIKYKTGLSFFELDLRSCHAKIFEDIFDWSRFDRTDLPDLDSLWPIMIRDFWEKADAVIGFDRIKEQIKGWESGDLKGLLKNQFYKALNGGMPAYAEDNVERSRTKLGIAKQDQHEFNEFLHLTFEQMRVFVLESAFIDQLNDGINLYLPNDDSPFPTVTLSKKQQLRATADPDYTPNKQTANSRLFSNMELCLILHVLSAIVETGRPWLIIGYEADGVLVCTNESEEAIRDTLALVNERFQSSILGLTAASHGLETKNLV